MTLDEYLVVRPFAFVTTLVDFGPVNSVVNRSVLGSVNSIVEL